MNKENEVKDWLLYAQRYYKAALFLKYMKPIPFDIICFHCMHSAEKYLKSFLLSKNEPAIKAEDLVILNEKCTALDTDFQRIKFECVYLANYGIISRSPGLVNLTDKNMEKALSNAENIKDFVLNKIIQK